MNQGARVLCTYWPKPGHEEELRQLLLKHGPTLAGVGLLGDLPVQIWKATQQDGVIRFVERFDWRDADSPNTAHQLPEVMAVWEPMGRICERMDFSAVEPIAGEA